MLFFSNWNPQYFFSFRMEVDELRISVTFLHNCMVDTVEPAVKKKNDQECRNLVNLPSQQALQVKLFLAG